MVESASTAPAPRASGRPGPAASASGDAPAPAAATAPREVTGQTFDTLITATGLRPLLLDSTGEGKSASRIICPFSCLLLLFVSRKSAQERQPIRRTPYQVRNRRYLDETIGLELSLSAPLVIQLSD